MREQLSRQLQTVPRRLVEFFPPSVSLHLRGWKNYPRMHGLCAPARAFYRLVPEGRNAVDAGANLGIYAYWLAHRARQVYAFEPQLGLSNYLRSANIHNIEVFNVALTDAAGVGTLWVPAVDGEASLVNHVGSESATPIPVQLARLDDYNLLDVGFIKIDVEGHEFEVLRGSEATVRRWRPTLFIEIEQRYHQTPIAELFDYITQILAYRCAYFWRYGHLSDLTEFRLDRDQLAKEGDLAAGYTNNFVFSDTSLI